MTRPSARSGPRVPRRPRRLLMLAGFSLAGLAGILALTVGVTETVCRGSTKPLASSPQPIMDTADRRDEVNSYLTYPEWSIVYGYDDLAGVMRASSESDFGYGRSIAGFWSGLCGVKQEASTRGPISFDYNSMVYTIGASYTLEMGIKGLYEQTIGRVTAFIRGPTRTPEDLFALKAADDYAAFLRQVPWYEFPFGTTLWRFWTETPLWGGNVIRKIERRVALSMEYGVKGVYARGIKALAGLSPAPLRIRSVVRAKGATVADIVTIKDLGQGATLIETPRYKAFTEIIQALATAGGDFVEIAGNSNILVTVVASGGATIEPALGRLLFSVPIQARPGLMRVGYDVRVDRLSDVIRSLATSRMELDHVYDY